MKYNPDKKTKEILIGVCLVGAALILFVYILNNLSTVTGAIRFVITGLSSIIIGLVFAYFLSIPSKWIERAVLAKIMPKAKHSTKRAISIVATLLFALAIIAGLLSIVLPRLISSLGMLLGNLESYRDSVVGWLDRLSELTHQDLSGSIISSITESLEGFIAESLEDLSALLPAAWTYATGVVTGFIRMVFGIVISVYILASREKLVAQFKKLCTAVFPNKFMERATYIARTMDKTFHSYLYGQLIDALLVGVECYILSLVFSLTYAPLLAVIVGVTNMIPILGPYIGGIPCAFIVLVAGSPLKMLIFIIMILVIQQVDANIVAPRIIGDRTGVAGIWVITGVMIGANFFGILGVLLVIPVISVLIKLVREFADKRLEQKGEPVSITEYYTVPPEPPMPRKPRAARRVKKQQSDDNSN